MRKPAAQVSRELTLLAEGLPTIVCSVSILSAGSIVFDLQPPQIPTEICLMRFRIEKVGSIDLRLEAVSDADEGPFWEFLFSKMGKI